MIKFIKKKDPTCDGVSVFITVPSITCDQCFKEITDARVARVAVQIGLRGELETGEPIFLHNACLNNFKRRLPKRTEEEFATETAGWNVDARGSILLGESWQERFRLVSMHEWFRLLEDNTGADVAGYRADVDVQEQSMKESASEGQRIHQLWEEGRARWARMQEAERTRTELESSGD